MHLLRRHSQKQQKGQHQLMQWGMGNLFEHTTIMGSIFVFA
jgi:hypothetical protein